MTKKPANSFFIPRGESFDFEFLEYNDDGRLDKLKKRLNNRSFTVGQTHIAYRAINHWQQEGLLPEGMQDNSGWRKFTLIELLWLRVICRLRKFGLSLDKIALVKKSVMDWDKDEGRYPRFEYDVVRAWISGSDPHICVLEDGRANIATVSQLIASKMLYGNFDVLLISLKSVLEEVGKKVHEADSLSRLSGKEVELMSTLRSQKNHQVNTRMNSNGEIAEIETAATTHGTQAVLKVIKEIEEEKEFVELTSKFEAGVRQSVRVTKRKRLE